MKRLRAGLLLLLAGAAQAAPVTYHCPAEKMQFQASFTPERVHLSLNDLQMQLARVPAAGQARYEDRRTGVSLTTLKREAVLKIGSSELRCEFTIKP